MLKIYKSSAGSGKTFTLVKEYLRIALTDTDVNKFKHILAITFTNKAANEMKERIVKALRQISEGTSKTNVLLEQLLEATNLDNKTLQKRASDVLQNILHNYADLSVCTIDAFTHRIVRSFSYDLKISSSFEIEMDETELLHQAANRLLDSISDDSSHQITKVLIDFAENNLQDGKGWDLEKSIVSFSKQLFTEDAAPYIKLLTNNSLEDFLKAKESLYAIKRTFENNVSSIAESAVNLIKKEGLSPTQFYYSSGNIASYFYGLAPLSSTEKLAPNSRTLKSIEEDKWTNAKTTTQEMASIECIKGELTVIFFQIQEIRKNEESAYILANLLLKNIYSMMLLNEMQVLLEDYQFDNNILHISEFQARIHKIVSEQEAPIIYERIGDWYDAILIDEFQDTSVLQWQNLVPLVENAQMKMQDSLIVGDGKQSIYRFRGGDVKQFVELPKIYGSDFDALLKERETAILNYGVKELYLKENFRSRNEIISFNNNLYQCLGNIPAFNTTAIYAEQAQEFGRNLEGGYVQLNFLEPTEELSYQETRNGEILRTIENVKEKGYQLRDIAILTRGNALGSEIASYLLQENIPVVSSESLLLNQSFAIKTVISVLYYLNDKSNAIKRSEILYFVQNSLLKEDQEKFKTIISSDYKEFENYLTTLLGQNFSSTELLQSRLMDLVGRIISLFKLTNQRDAFMQFFMDTILEFSTKYNNRIVDFLEWWEEKKGSLSIVYPDTLDAVKVMTVHKSKGLEFPIVIIPDADSNLKNTKNLLWTSLEDLPQIELEVCALPYNEELEKTTLSNLYQEEKSASFTDMLNILYVATTRAEEGLYIISKAPKKEPTEIKGITALLVYFLKQTNNWNGFKVYEFGDKNTRALKKEMSPNDEVFNYQEVTIGKEKQLEIKRSSKILWNETRAQQVDYGNLLHEILSKISTKEDAPIILRKYFLKGMLPQSEFSKIENDVSSILNHTSLKEAFQKEMTVYQERVFIDKKGARKVPDRISWNKSTNEAIVIDYKTGEEDPEHVAQINEYAHLIEASGMRCAKKYLVYTESKNVISC